MISYRSNPGDHSPPATSPAASRGGGVFATAAKGRFPYAGHRTVEMVIWHHALERRGIDPNFRAKPVSNFVATPPRNTIKLGKCTACTASVQRTCDWHGCPQRPVNLNGR